MITFRSSFLSGLSFYFSMYGYGRTAILFCIRDEMDDGR
jgi:hypothetical protein